jgi:hypothetical protein
MALYVTLVPSTAPNMTLQRPNLTVRVTLFAHVVTLRLTVDA